ncbi:MAG: error-prone DNA polymerase [Acidimicrobiia bacterium]|nr:error-prone DNA polymerase [Acidimicrobiia bacterium]
MAWNNPPVPWREIEQALSDRRPASRLIAAWGDGGDSPAWSRKRPTYDRQPIVRPTVTTPYAELHCHSNFSFLDGASHAEELVEESVRLGLEALALTDHNGFYGVVRFAEAARAHGLPTIFGAELTLGVEHYEPGRPDPQGEHLLVLARNPAGYASLARLLSEAQMAGEKSAPRTSFARMVELGGAVSGGSDWVVLTACRKGTVPAVLEREGPAAARRRLAELTDAFGVDNVQVELWDHGQPLDSARNDALAELAVRAGVGVVATGNVHYHAPSRRRLATAMAAVRARRSLDELDGWLPAGAGSHLRSGDEQQRRFARYPGVVEAAAELGLDCAFDLRLVAPELPPYPCPAGRDEMSWLRELVERGAAERYGPRGAERVPGAYRQLDHELDLVAELGFPGYFLVVWDIVDFCRRSRIFCQGRGSAANSAVCYALGITNADAVSLGLLFERFLSPERDGPPDIDIDIESDRREEVIQYVYERYGREHTAQVANVITYRSKSSVRDMAKALGYTVGQQDAFSKSIDRWVGLADQGGPDGDESPSSSPSSPIPDDVVELAREIEHFPRHLGIHSGGMVICDRPVLEVCPTEWARMENRSVLQWDKDDCAAVGLVKFDLLGLGMLSALHYVVDMVAEHHGVEHDIALLAQEDEVYDMICQADTIGVFQIESRAQMATLPRLRPRCFYDLVVEVALIRPGPIQGGSVHPFIRRRNGLEPVTYLHPLLENALAKTLGVPLFQEQLMQIAIDVGGFSPAEADQLRQAMGSKRSIEAMTRLQDRMYEGMAERGITGEVADQIWHKLVAFANYGFPESHSVSFAYLVYASCWFKYHYPAGFCAALLNAQPMGFYSPHSLVQDARRHGVEVHTPDLNASAATATLVTVDGDRGRDPARPETWGHGGPAVRLGLSYVRHVGDDLAEAIAEGRPYTSMEDLQRRHDLPLHVLESMATAGVFEECFGLSRREALWSAGAVVQSRPDRLAGVVTGDRAPTLPGMSEQETALADLWATGVAPDGHPTRFLRPALDARGVVTGAGLKQVANGARIEVAGVVTHRQRPATAAGTTFINLEDETGLINIVCSQGCWLHHRQVAGTATALLVKGRVENNEGVVNVVAERLEPLHLAVPMASRDFR